MITWQDGHHLGDQHSKICTRGRVRATVKRPLTKGACGVFDIHWADVSWLNTLDWHEWEYVQAERWTLSLKGNLLLSVGCSDWSQFHTRLCRSGCGTAFKGSRLCNCRGLSRAGRERKTKKEQWRLRWWLNPEITWPLWGTQEATENHPCCCNYSTYSPKLPANTCIHVQWVQQQRACFILFRTLLFLN